MAGDAFVTCCILLAYYVLCVITCEFAFRYSVWKYKAVKRERKFLNALIKDYEEVSKSAELITQEARQILDADLIKDDIIQVLKEVERSWLLKAREVVIKSATPFIQKFEDLRKRRESLKRYACALVNPVPVVSAAFRIKWLEEQIHYYGLGIHDYPVYAHEISDSLKRSRSEVRSLLDKSSVDEIELVKTRRLVGLAADGLIFSPENLKVDNADLMRGMEVQIISFRMHLRLLNAFMKDLQCQLKLKVLESQMESCWVVEAIETTEEAKDVIDTMSRAGKQRGAISQWPPVSYLNNWKARRKLRRDMKYVCFRISGLLEIIDRYGINFVSVDSSKPSHKQTIDQHEAIDDTTLSSPAEVVDLISDCLNQLPETSNKLKHDVSSLRRELRNMIESSEFQRASENLVNLTKGCLEELKSIWEAHMQDSNRRPSKFHSEIIVAIKNAVQLVETCIKTFSIELTWSKDSRSAVGLENDIDNLVSELIDNSAEHPSIICIWGMKGIGKTTLAKKVYYHKAVGDHFEVKRWISIPQVSNENLLSGNVGKQSLLEQLETHCNMGMREFLKEKKCLVVFDNVSSKEAWNAIETAFSDISEGSKIVLITSNKALALDAGKKSNHPIRLRTKEESWQLFTQMVKISPDDKKEIAIAKKIVDTVGGLPLGMIGVGYQLWREEVKEETLSRVLERINRGQNGTVWSDNLKANMVELQHDQVLWKCLSYFQLFPKDVEIPTRRILASLVAPRLEIPFPPYQYLVKLIERNLVQIIEAKPDEKVKTCRLPSPMLDLLLQGQVNSSKIQSTGSSLGFRFDKNGLIRKKSADIRQNESYNNFILFIDTREGNKPQQEIGEYLRSSVAGGSFQQLQFLDLEGVFQPQLPKTIGKLKQLVYLGLRRTYLETVPSSIGDLVNLHTLDLKHTYIQSLPSLIWKLEKLQYLYLNHNCQMPQPNAISMGNLQILSGVLVHTLNIVKVWLDKLSDLRKLELAFQLEESEKKVLDPWVDKLTKLEVLKVRSIDEKKGPQLLILEHLSYLKKLSSLYLFGRLGNPYMILILPESLKQLTLSASEIEEDPMPILGKLPNLRSLSLFSSSYKGKHLVCSRGGFPLLLVLKLWNLRFLENLQVAGAMQKLRKLEIRSCSILKIPPELTHLTEKSAAQPAK